MEIQKGGTRARSRLDDAMALLDPRSRRVIELWLEGAGPGAIAETLGLSERAVTVIRGSAIWRLRELIARQPCPELADLTEIKPV